jgi:WXG100 family type VII secretion target
MPKFEVSVEELVALSAAYREIAMKIETDLAALTGRAAPLRDGWIGSSSISFQATAHDIEAARGELCSALERMATLLASASHAYSSVEENLRQAFS